MVFLHRYNEPTLLLLHEVCFFRCCTHLLLQIEKHLHHPVKTTLGLPLLSEIRFPVLSDQAQRNHIMRISLQETTF